MQSIQKCGLEHCKVAKYIDIALLRSCRKDWWIEMKNVQISQDKTAPTEEEKEKARREYLDKRGVPDSFRW